MRLLSSLIPPLLFLYLTRTSAEENSWSWGGKPADNFEKAGFQLNEGEDLMPAESSQQPSGEEKANAEDKQDDDELIDSIVKSTRQGRHLEGFDEVYSDPNVQDALQNNGDQPETRNIVRDKLCDLGLMQCEVEGKRPFISPEDLVYAQPVDIQPVGGPIPTIPLKTPKRIPYPSGPIRGPLGPPGPPGKYGPTLNSPVYPGPNRGYKPIGPKPGSYYGNPNRPPPPPPGPNFEYVDYVKKPSFAPPPLQPAEQEFPFDFEVPNNKKQLNVAAITDPVQQHVHHHFHHSGDNGASSPAASLIGGAIGETPASQLFKPSSNNFALGGLSTGGFKPNGLTIGGSGHSSGSYGGQTIANYGGFADQFANFKPVSENNGPQTFGASASSLFGTNSLGASVGTYGTSGLYKKELNLGGGNSNYLQGSYAGNYGTDVARNENYDCVCVPYDQCPTADLPGKRDDLYLAIDPRNLKSNIEALTEERVITDGNGTMTVVRVPKEAKEDKTEDAKAEDVVERKVVKREAVNATKSAEAREDGAAGGNNKNIRPTFGVSFGLPNQGGGGYPLNPYGPNPFVNPYGGTSGINLGLVSVNPLLSVQLTKDEYGEKVIKPFVNLHVTPNDFLVHKFRDLVSLKKDALFHQHQHYHDHAYPPPPPRPIYYRPPYAHPHPGPVIHRPPPPVYHRPIYSSYIPGPPGLPDLPHFDEDDVDERPDYDDDDYYGRTVHNQTNQIEQQHNVYSPEYNNYFNNDVSRRGKAILSSNPIKFPQSRRRRGLTNGTEKRQAFYPGGRPEGTCGPRLVCCRKPVRPHIPNPGFGQHNQCGIRHTHGINGRIKNPVYIEGDSEFGEYPWQVAILKKDPKESVYVCGGTLIDHLYIITAAHCVKSYTNYDLRVRLGEWDVNHDVEFYPYIERDVVGVEVHPEFYAGTLYNDLAILKMDKPVDFAKYPHISPACLPTPQEDFTGLRCWTTGWGKDAFGEFGKYQNILKEVDVPIVGFQQCQHQLQQTRLGYEFKLHPGFVCAGGEEGKDACKGDGGGPMVCERGGTWKVVGVVSWGIGCGQNGVPGVYVRVAHYLDWIRQVTQRY